jgi:hypothetical protein
MAETVWTAGAVIGGGYVLLFLLARRPVSLRPGRIGGLLAGVCCLRLVAAAAGEPLDEPMEWTGLALVGIAAAALGMTWRSWLVRATAEELRDQVEIACRGLFLGIKEPRAGRIQLAAPGEPTLHLRNLAPRVQLLTLVRMTGSGKTALLHSWLAKQYPGPVPRLQIVLNGGDS